MAIEDIIEGGPEYRAMIQTMMERERTREQDRGELQAGEES